MTKVIDFTKAINSLNIIQTNVLDAVNMSTLKDGKESIRKTAGLALEFEKVAFNLNNLIFDGFTKIEKTRTKKAFVDECKSLFSFLKTEIQRAITLQAESYKENKEDKEKKPSLKVLATNIKRDLDKAQRCFLSVGKSLTIALDTFKEDGKKQADFLAWANDVCEIKKAQAYKLMKVYKEFGDSSDFKGVSMRVLYTLTGQSQLVVDKAREIARDGKLDTKALDSIIMEVTTPAPPVPPVSSLAPVPPEINNNSNTPETDRNVLTRLEITGTENLSESESEKDYEIQRLNDILEHTIKERDALKVDPVSTPETPKSDAESETARELRETITELRETVQTLQTELKEARENKKESITVKVLPYLPQFDSACFNIRLGLDMTDATNKAKINKAYRVLAKIYTASASKKASEALKEAREALLKNTE